METSAKSSTNVEQVSLYIYIFLIINLNFKAFITMATEIKNRMGPLQQASATSAVRIGPSQPVNDKKSGGCC